MNADLSPQQSSSDAAVGYEAAQEAIDGVLACYVALLEREGQKPEPDRERVAHLRARIADCTHQQRSLSLHPADGSAPLTMTTR